MKGEIKSHTVDKYLQPIRKQIKEHIESNSSVIDFGCGNGELLFQLSEKIKYGIGIDNSKTLIEYANRKKDKKCIQNLNFRLIDLNTEFMNHESDYACVSLLFHVLSEKNAIDLLNQIISTSKTTIICAFSKPENWRQKFFLWIDQRFTGHYQNFKMYQKNGHMVGMLEKIENIQYRCFDTFDPVIKIYKVTN